MGAASYAPFQRDRGRRSFAARGAARILLSGRLVAPSRRPSLKLLVARLFQGIGGGLILAGSMAFISILFEPQLRKYAVAATNVTWIIAAVVGPLQAGIFANFGWWRGAFFVYVPIGAAFLVGILWKIPKSADQATAGSRALQFPIGRVGLLGLGVLCVASSGLVEPAALRTALIVTAGLIVWSLSIVTLRPKTACFPRNHCRSRSRSDLVIGRTFLSPRLIFRSRSIYRWCLPFCMVSRRYTLGSLTALCRSAGQSGQRSRQGCTAAASARR